MKNTIKLFLLGISISANAQISTSTGGASNVLANSPTSNTYVGIGTNNPTSPLEVVGDFKSTQAFFTNSLPDGSVFASGSEQNNKCLVFSAGKLLGTGPGYLNNRMLTFYDFPQSNFNSKSVLFFGLEDRNDFGRYRFIAETGGTTQMIMLNKSQQELMKVFEDGADNVFMHFPKDNSRVIIGALSDYTNSLGHKLFVKNGSAKVEGNIFTDSNIGIGTSNFVDGTDTYRLSVNGAIRASRVKVYTTWADYVFEKDYKLPTLQEVEKHIIEKGHLLDIPSAKEVEEKGIELGEMNKLLLQKVEELTLYVIKMNKEIEELKSQNKKQ